MVRKKFAFGQGSKLVVQAKRSKYNFNCEEQQIGSTEHLRKFARWISTVRHFVLTSLTEYFTYMRSVTVNVYIYLVITQEARERLSSLQSSHSHSLSVCTLYKQSRAKSTIRTAVKKTVAGIFRKFPEFPTFRNFALRSEQFACLTS